MINQILYKTHTWISFPQHFLNNFMWSAVAVNYLPKHIFFSLRVAIKIAEFFQCDVFSYSCKYV